MKTALLIAAALVLYRWLRGSHAPEVSPDAIARASARTRAEGRDHEAHAPAHVRARIQERWAEAEAGRDPRFRRSGAVWRLHRRRAS